MATVRCWTFPRRECRSTARGGVSANRGSRFRWKSSRTRCTCRCHGHGGGDGLDRTGIRARRMTTRTIRSASRRRCARGACPARTGSRGRRPCYCSVCISCSWGETIQEKNGKNGRKRPTARAGDSVNTGSRPLECAIVTLNLHPRWMIPSSNALCGNTKASGLTRSGLSGIAYSVCFCL